MTKAETYIQYCYDLIQSAKYTSANSAYEFHTTDQNRPKPTVKLTQFKGYWKIASQRHTEAQISIQKEKEDLYRSKEIERKKADILQKEQVEKMMSDVVILAYNNVVQSKGKDKEVYAFSTAVEKYNKLKGFEAPTKTANTNANGEDVGNPLDKLIKSGGKIVINGK